MLRQEPFPDSDWLTSFAQPPSAGPPHTQAEEHSLMQDSWFYWHKWDQTSPKVLQQTAILNSDYEHYSSTSLILQAEWYSIKWMHIAYLYELFLLGI